MQPTNPILNILLHARLQLRLVQREVVHGAEAQGAVARESGADAVHEGAAGVAEVVGRAVTSLSV